MAAAGAWCGVRQRLEHKVLRLERLDLGGVDAIQITRSATTCISFPPRLVWVELWAEIVQPGH
jgi:hypothetical protein